MIKPSPVVSRVNSTGRFSSYAKGLSVIEGGSRAFVVVS